MPNQSLSLKSLKYVLFDWDNTLAESRTALVTVVNQVLAEYHMPNWDIVKNAAMPNFLFEIIFLTFSEMS